MKFRNFLRVQQDECLSSWVYRCSQSKKGQKFKILSDAYIDSDPDFDLVAPFFTPDIASLGLDVALFQRCFQARSEWVLPWAERVVYCPACFHEDIAAGWLPYWRKGWCYLHAPICIKHRRLLAVAEHYNPFVDKAWIAFAEDCVSPHDPDTRCRLPWRHPPVSKEVVYLAAKAQRFLHAAHVYATVRLIDGVTLSSAEVLKVSRFLLEYFLFPRLRPPKGDGVARGMQHSVGRIGERMTREQAKAVGCSDSDVFSRMTALILVGCVFGIVSAALFQSVARSLALTIYLERGGAYEIGCHGFTFLTMKEHREAVQFFENLSDVMKSRLSCFMRGLKDYRYKMGSY
ncbi:hypothetical protein FXN65_13200 [Metapseudomonas lalkuanensis]|uniref:TniQ family protein n=1 Tax=Metapseudomonas lalkuanensis TaxID=2604832 RepID=A0A5J6QKE5_9GAMM|nr:hypothetical protein [Pseudomonas lalkuanensis]QEY62984.1 hypothetical protein FXN65_13200 [Pseudomonas lalkuanensis]